MSIKNVDGLVGRVESYLIDNGFVNDPNNGIRKIYYKKISSTQTIRVKIISDENDVIDVFFEQTPQIDTVREKRVEILFDTVRNLDKLILLMGALTY